MVALPFALHDLVLIVLALLGIWTRWALGLATVVSVRHVTYDMNPSRRAVLEEHLVHVFPISLITGNDTARQ